MALIPRIRAHSTPLRVLGLITLAACALLCPGCNEIFRPVVIPGPITPPNPQNSHFVFAINGNGPTNPGTGMQIDVSGDTDIGVAPVGFSPAHAATLPDNSRVFVASTLSDSVASFVPGGIAGIAPPLTISLPLGSRPVFVHTAETTNMYVANAAANTVSVIDTGSNVVTQTVPVGVTPVALAETPDARKLYVVNQGDNSVTRINVADFTQAPVTGFTGLTPMWAVARGDSQRVYVLSQGDGRLFTIDATISPTADSVIGTNSVGAGANFLLYDSNLDRLYVTNPTTSKVYVFDASTDPPTPLGSPAGITISAPSLPKTPRCAGVPNPCVLTSPAPVSVAALPDGSRFYVASYVAAAPGAPCPDPNVTASQCIIAQVTVFNTTNNTVKNTVFPLFPALPTLPASGVQPFAATPVASCQPTTPYTPSSTRFRLFAAASAESSRIYVGMCDAGAVASIDTGNVSIPDKLDTDVPAPFSSLPPTSGNEPPPQNPVFLLTGQ